MKSCKPGTTRREFAKSCAALAGGSITSMLLQLEMTQSLVAAGPSDDFRALVCLFLNGGNDSFNMLVPRDNTEYAAYSAIRGGIGSGGLAIPQADLLPISDAGGRPFGLHPAMTQLKPIYDAGQAAMVANVGSLVQPTDKSMFSNNDPRLPLGLFSHSDLVRQWQTSMPRTRDAITGWGGRMADLLTDPSRRDDPISMNIAVNSTNIFQSAKYANPYTVTADGTIERSNYYGDWNRDLIYRRVYDQTLAASNPNLVKQTHSVMTDIAIRAAELYNTATADAELQTVFPTTPLGRNFERIAKTIAARQQLNHGRQIFFVEHGTWDHHSELINSHSNNLAEVDGALAAFNAAMIELDLYDCVLTFTASDFGRTLAGNGQGSDHGWGGNQIVMGGGINGGRVYGDYPATLAANNPLDVGRGRLIPTTSVDQYAAEMALWFGIGNNADLEMILPNVRTFFAAGGGGTPLGMFA